jgi:hypothetical protein
VTELPDFPLSGIKSLNEARRPIHPEFRVSCRNSM